MFQNKRKTGYGGVQQNNMTVSSYGIEIFYFRLISLLLTEKRVPVAHDMNRIIYIFMLFFVACCHHNAGSIRFEKFYITEQCLFIIG
jgi:hypothetical protein